MRYRRLGGTDLRVSEIGFGVWTVSTGWWGKVEPDDGVKLLQQALGLGINFFDTADTYGDGFGEEILAKALGAKRHETVIATKGGYDFYAHPERQGHRERPQSFDPAFIRFACEESLRRLRTDYIDLYQLHNPRLEAIARDDLFATLEALRREGKVRYYGVALGPDIGWSEEGEAAMRQRRAHALQIIYSILEQEPARKFFPIAQEAGTGLLSRVPHASEVLTDRFKAQPPVFTPEDHRSHRKQQWLREAVARVAKLSFLAERYPMTLGQAAIRFCLAQPAIAAVLPNITSMDELREYAAASERQALSPEDLGRIEEMYDHSFYLEGQPQDAAEGNLTPSRESRDAGGEGERG